MTGKELVATKLQELMDRLDEADEEVQNRLARALPMRIIQIEVPDIDASFWTELEDGRMDGLHEGRIEDADIRVTARSDNLVDMIDGKKSLFSSYVAGHIRIDASMGDLFALRKLM